LVIFNGGSKSPITRKKNIGPPTIYYKNCHNRGLAHVPCMTRTPTRYPHRFIWVWCVGLDPRSTPNNWGHSKPTPGYVYGLCVPRSGSGSRNPRNYKIVFAISPKKAKKANTCALFTSIRRCNKPDLGKKVFLAPFYPGGLIYRIRQFEPKSQANY
jgi:hypothetical protein